MQKGYFVISLDFELFWGMFDKHTLKSYGDHIAGEKEAIPKMLQLFSEYDIHATWATVGMLMARDKTELLKLLPSPTLQPTYQDQSVSSYFYIENTEMGTNEQDDPYHYGPSLLEKILYTPNQEIANHTFSHFYCVDGKKNDPEIFTADMDAFITIAKTYDISATSIVFPRNQTSKEALAVCKTKGITAYRGNEKHFLYRAREDKKQSFFIRGLRLLDHYINITGAHTYKIPKMKDGLVNVPASRFLRPWSKVLRLFEPVRMRRITRAMTRAAKRGEVFHLWWHPHNFGINQDQNFKNLTHILEHYKVLEEKYGMHSASMKEIATLAS